MNNDDAILNDGVEHNIEYTLHHKGPLLALVMVMASDYMAIGTYENWKKHIMTSDGCVHFHVKSIRFRDEDATPDDLVVLDVGGVATDADDVHDTILGTAPLWLLWLINLTAKLIDWQRDRVARRDSRNHK